VNLRPKFWETVPLNEMTQPEWEALCDGCGKCCLNKIEDEDSGEVFLTRVACRLLDDETCQCKQYETRKSIVPECIQLTPKTLEKHMYWMPKTCAYRMLHKGEALHNWHPLITGNPQSVHDAEVSVQGFTVPENEVHDDDWEHHIIQEPV
jgi:uncharacterized cysteine cluster protein YcgN (CxxCxxCC family)